MVHFPPKVFLIFNKILHFTFAALPFHVLWKLIKIYFSCLKASNL